MPERAPETDQEVDNALEITEKKLKDRKVSWGRLRRVDSLHLEAGRLSFNPSHGSKVDWRTTMILAFQTIGVVYGDIGTSPLYVYSSTFTDGIDDLDDILGVLSLIIYTILLVPVLKYAFIVLWANDNGDGGTFALYSLLCRYAKISLIPNQQPEDMEVSNYSLEIPSSKMRRSQKIKEKLEKSTTAKILLFTVTILGTSMVIGDGVLTPCISVLSAVSGIDSLGKNAVVGISVAILVLLFSFQRFGTDKVGYSFAPIICLWFMLISGVGAYNLFKYDLGVLRAFYPKYILDYFTRNGTKGWISLGGIVMCITGTEAMFADLGHFNVRAIQMSFSGLVCPALLTAYAGQAAYLRKHPQNVANTFYDSIPDPLYWPTFVVAVAAAIIASQAMISGAFAIVSQSLSLSCFPRVKVVHTSAKYEGQVYIPEVNYALMIACVLVTLAFQTTEKIGHAYGIAVVAVMVMTTCMVALIMLVIWKTSIWWIGVFFVVFISIESVYFSAVLYKFTQGGYLPLALSLFLMIVMATWHYVHKERYVYELDHKVSASFVSDLAKDVDGINRVPGIGLLYSELVQGIPPIFTHFVSTIPSVHSVLVCVSIKSLPISRVAPEERFLFRQVEPREYRMFRCVVRYGYKDAIEEPEEFERQLVEGLKYFILHQSYYYQEKDTAESTNAQQNFTTALKDPRARLSGSSPAVHVEETLDEPSRVSSGSIHSFHAPKSGNSSTRIASGQIKGGATAEEEMQFVQRARERGVVYLMGETEVAAKPNSSLFKIFVVNYVYSFLRKNFRQGDKVLAIPRTRLLRVGMTYEI